MTVTRLFLAAIVLIASQAQASVLVSPSGGDIGYGYGFSKWSGFTSALDTASGNTVTVGNLNDLPTMLTYDALFVDQRWTGGSLSATELGNIASFIATGRRVAMIGENNSWASWNNQILGLVGGSHGGQSSATTSPVVANELTAGVGAISLPTAGVANGGTALFDVNWATLWNSNTLTLLDVNVFANWSGNNAQFGTNVANWLTSGGNNGGGNVPVPAPLALLLTGVASLLLARRSRKSA